MFKYIKSLFSKKEQVIEIPEEPEEEVLEQPLVLPDVIEVPWSQAAGIKNFEDSINKLHDDLKSFFYDVKMKEYKAIKAIERLEEASDLKIKEIKEDCGIPEDIFYYFEIPEATGRPGFLKKKKPNK
jgi:hypothetical protein